MYKLLHGNTLLYLYNKLLPRRLAVYTLCTFKNKFLPVLRLSSPEKQLLCFHYLNHMQGYICLVPKYMHTLGK